MPGSARELLFGYIPAVLAGFLLTAMPSWTVTPDLPVRRQMLLAALLWIIGFSLFCRFYIPVLTASRAAGRPG